MKKLTTIVLLVCALGCHALENKFLEGVSIEKSSVSTTQKESGLSAVRDRLFFVRDKDVHSTTFIANNDISANEVRNDLKNLRIEGQFSEYKDVLYFSSKGVLYSCELKNGLWANPQELNIDGYDTDREIGCGSTLFYGKWCFRKNPKQKEPMFNPCVANKGSRIYFSSNREGGKGGLDIWYIERKGDGQSWSAPINLESVNSERDDDYPFVDSDNVLYFSSDREAAYKGLNIYIKTLADPSPASIMESVFNSDANDYNFVVVGGVPFYISDKGGDADIYFAKQKQEEE